MIGRGYVDNFSPLFLHVWFIHVSLSSINTQCSFYLADNERCFAVIHNFQFRCKITKFISFTSNKRLKKNIKSLVKLPFFHYSRCSPCFFVFIHSVVHKLSTVIHTSYPQFYFTHFYLFYPCEFRLNLVNLQPTTVTQVYHQLQPQVRHLRTRAKQ